MSGGNRQGVSTASSVSGDREGVSTVTNLFRFVPLLGGDDVLEARADVVVGVVGVVVVVENKCN